MSLDAAAGKGWEEARSLFLLVRVLLCASLLTSKRAFAVAFVIFERAEGLHSFRYEPNCSVFVCHVCYPLDISTVGMSSGRFRRSGTFRNRRFTCQGIFWRSAINEFLEVSTDRLSRSLQVAKRLASCRLVVRRRVRSCGRGISLRFHGRVRPQRMRLRSRHSQDLV